MSAVDQFASYISENAHSISNEIVEYVVGRIQPEISEEEKEMALSMYIKLLGFFSESLKNEHDRENFVPEHLIDWSKKNAEMQVASGGRLSDIIVRYPMTRDVFTDIVTRISVQLPLSTEMTGNIIKRINGILDISLNETVFAFERLSDESRNKLQKELISLSAPIVPIRNEVVVLPLVGYIDEDRAKFIMETAVPKIAGMNVDFVIIDFSGVLTINRRVSESLHQIGSMLWLMGIQVVTTGLRPELVRVAVNSNIELSSAHSFSTVKQALENLG